MPYLNARISGSPSPEVVAKVAGALADLTTDILGKKRELTSVAVEPVDDDRWFVGGAPVSSQGTRTFFLEIHVTEGTNTKDEKADYVREVFASMQSILGGLHPASYVVIKPIAADSWGYEGATQEFRYIKGKGL